MKRKQRVRVPWRAWKSERASEPHCTRCKKKLVWTTKLRGSRRGMTREEIRSLSRQRTSQRSKVAIRCLHCRTVLCPACAKKHFVHLEKTYRAVDHAVALVAHAAIREIEKKIKASGGALCTVEKMET